MALRISSEELDTMVRVSRPDAWYVSVLYENAEECSGDFQSLEEALEEYVEIATHETPDMVRLYLVPVWNPLWHTKSAQGENRVIDT